MTIWLGFLWSVSSYSSVFVRKGRIPSHSQKCLSVPRNSVVNHHKAHYEKPPVCHPLLSLPLLLPSVSFPLQHGVIVADEEEYFIEPLSPGANVSTGSEGKGSPHVVYKRSSLQYPHMDAACGVLGICTHQRILSPSQCRLVVPVDQALKVHTTIYGKEPNLSPAFEKVFCI